MGSEWDGAVEWKEAAPPLPENTPVRRGPLWRMANQWRRLVVQVCKSRVWLRPRKAVTQIHLREGTSR